MGAGDEMVVMRAKYKTATKDPGTPGVLKMVPSFSLFLVSVEYAEFFNLQIPLSLQTEEEFAFKPNDPTWGFTLRVAFKSIKGALLLLLLLFYGHKFTNQEKSKQALLNLIQRVRSQKPEGQPVASCKGSCAAHSLSPHKPALFYAHTEAQNDPSPRFAGKKSREREKRNINDGKTQIPLD
ncbi:hypothetical protein Cgig2_014537 [Carnegiea gigantea]|uniref:Uncharacterized protein n=1 Tax=Carnegiea gigantea TaxID=171969 RepID=A0A9Q1K192_9CARY|nr:hypothetical protein Cgig2_014537 [Carnegiea gigantea]